MKKFSYTATFSGHKGKVSDKFEGYFSVYDSIVEKIVSDRPAILEIGVQNGGSLEIWGKCFPSAALILGIDINEDCKKLEFENSQIKVLIADAKEQETQSKASELCQCFDLVVDDGSHVQNDIIQTFINMFKLVKPGGFYVIEDLHTSYWSEYGGGFRDGKGSIEFFKRIIDGLYFRRLGFCPAPGSILGIESALALEAPESFFSEIKSLTFKESMVVVEKRAMGEPQGLGLRAIAGENELVAFGHHNLDKTELESPIQSYLPEIISARLTPNAPELLITKLNSLESEARLLSQDLDRSISRLNQIENSKVYKLAKWLKIIKI